MNYTPNDLDLESIAEIVVEVTHELFAQAGYEGDFCIQATGFESVVFGGTNRVIWHPITGYRFDEPFCSERFMEKFNKALMRSKGGK